ncbi:hypothetical protein F8R89_33935 [Streptomyces sp. SS1-1]|uniref:hypothetical protein n=1 Tax=Streptomyces sp. SS1-1 TaxID=2651869 RepID=UPI00124F9FE2|nr:hypothetical protein [Streptomyces sp. SS1-1]KAB2976575.1 hypothetical protein F8R89_33935 [Streptomyces sp. SS1-1]
MTYRRAAIPALTGAVLITLLLWWAGASAHVLQLQGATRVLGIESVLELRRWLAPWAYDPSVLTSAGDGTGVSGTPDYSDLRRTGMQIRFVALFALYGAGALLLLRRMPPSHGRTPGTLLALWAWGPVAGTLAAAVSTPWLIASGGQGGYRFLPRLAAGIESSGPVAVLVALLTAGLTVLVGRVVAKDGETSPRSPVPARPARLAASLGTALVAVSLLVLSYDRVAARVHTAFSGSGRLSEPGDLLRQWLILGGWTGPGSTGFGDWLAYRLVDVLMLAVVWWALRLLPGLLTRVTFPAMAVGGVCATVLALLAGQILRIPLDDTLSVWGPTHFLATLGTHIPAALTFGTLAGTVSYATLRLTSERTTPTPQPVPAA